MWHDLLAEGIPCGLHRIERLMRLQTASQKLVRAGVDCRPIWVAAAAADVLERSFSACPQSQMDS
jgi:putative transposase